MRSAYKFLAYAIDALILLQAAAMAWAVFGLTPGSRTATRIDKAKLESHDGFLFTEERGFMIHGINGQLLIPLVGLILLIISFFAKVPEGVKWAGDGLRSASCVQVGLGIFGHSLPALGFIHGFCALLLFWLAWRTAKQADVVIERHHGV